MKAIPFVPKSMIQNVEARRIGLQVMEWPHGLVKMQRCLHRSIPRCPKMSFSFKNAIFERSEQQSSASGRPEDPSSKPDLICCMTSHSDHPVERPVESEVYGLTWAVGEKTSSHKLRTSPETNRIASN